MQAFFLGENFVGVLFFMVWAGIGLLGFYGRRQGECLGLFFVLWSMGGDWRTLFLGKR